MASLVQSQETYCLILQAEVLVLGQSFYLHLLAQSLRHLGDPDVDIIDNNVESCYVDGVHLGHVHPLGSTLHIYQRKVKQSKYDESEWLQGMENYFKGDERPRRDILTNLFALLPRAS